MRGLQEEMKTLKGNIEGNAPGWTDENRREIESRFVNVTTQLMRGFSTEASARKQAVDQVEGSVKTLASRVVQDAVMKLKSEMVMVAQKNEMMVLRKLHGTLDKGQYLSDKAILKRELGGWRVQMSRLETRGRDQVGTASGKMMEERSFQRAKKFIEDECAKIRRTIDLVAQRLVEGHKVLEKECDGNRGELQKFDGTLRTLAESLNSEVIGLRCDIRKGIAAGRNGPGSSVFGGAIDLTGDDREERFLRQLREVEAKVNSEQPRGCSISK